MSEDKNLSDLLENAIVAYVENALADTTLFADDFSLFEREGNRHLADDFRISFIEFLYLDSPFRVKALDCQIAKALMELRDELVGHIYGEWYSNVTQKTAALPLIKKFEPEFLNTCLLSIYEDLREEGRDGDYSDLSDLFEEGGGYLIDDVLIPSDAIEFVESELTDALCNSRDYSSYTLDELLKEQAVFWVIDDLPDKVCNIDFSKSLVLQRLASEFLGANQKTQSIFPTKDVLDLEGDDDDELEQMFYQRLEDRDSLLKALLREYPEEFECRSVLRYKSEVDSFYDKWFKDWSIDSIPKDLLPIVSLERDESLVLDPFVNVCRILNKDIVVLSEDCHHVKNKFHIGLDQIPQLYFIPSGSLFLDYEVLGGDLGSCYSDSKDIMTPSASIEKRTIVQDLVIQDFSNIPFSDTRKLPEIVCEKVLFRNLDINDTYILSFAPSTKVVFEVIPNPSLVIQTIEIDKHLDSLSEGFTLTSETYSELRYLFQDSMKIRDHRTQYTYNLTISEPRASILLKVNLQEYETLDGINFFSSAFVHEIKDTSVAIIYLMDNKQKSIFKRQHLVKGLPKQERLQDVGFRVVDGIYIQYDKTEEYFPFGEDNSVFIESIGFKENGKFYKNSNFIAYAYLYMLLPQIVGRFSEHLQDDIVSQSLPLGLVIDAVFSDQSIDSPAKFLMEGYELCKKNKHPLSFSLEVDEVDPLEAFSKSTKLYRSFVRYLYSFIELYTKPLALLYNAYQFSIPARQNPYIFKDQSRLACNYGVDFSTGAWVSVYFEALKASQSKEFIQDSILIEGQAPGVDLISQEIERFVSNASVEEFEDIMKLRRLETDFFKIDLDKLPPAFSLRGDALANTFRNTIVGWPTDILEEGSTIFSAFGEFQNGRFNQMLSKSITFLSKFATYTLSPLFVNDEFESSVFFKLFLSSENVNRTILHKLPIGGNILEWFTYDSHLKKLEKNNSVIVRDANGEYKIPICYANLNKNVIPYELIRRFLLTFKSHKPFSVMGKDSRLAIPQGKRLRLGAFVGLIWTLKQAQEAFLKIQDASIYGPVQSFGGTYLEMKNQDSSKNSNFEDERYEFSVRQATANKNEYIGGELTSATNEQIKNRLVNLTSAYSICIGQSSMDYIQQAQRGELEVFTLFHGETNISTIGFRANNIIDQKGQNNQEPYTRSTECVQFMLNWLFDLFFTNCVSEESFVEFLKDEDADESDLEIKRRLLFGNYSIDNLLKRNTAFINAHHTQLTETQKITGLCTRLQIVIDQHFEDEFVRDSLRERLEAFAKIYGKSDSLIHNLLHIESSSNQHVGDLSLLNNGIVNKAKAHFRD